MEKVSLYFPLSRVWPNPFLPPPRPAFPLSILAAAQPGPARPTSRPRGTISARASPILPQQLTAGSRAPAPLPGGTALSGSSSTSCPSRTRAAPQPRASFTRRSLDFARLLSFKYRPEAPLAPPSISSRSRRVKLTGIRRRDPPNPQFAAAVRPEPREPLAGLPVALAKSPNRFFRDFVFSVRS